MSLRTSDRKGTISHDYTVGHEYEFVVRAIGPDGTEEPMESAARNTIVIRGKTSTPGLITDLAAVGYVEAISLTWTTPSDYDYYKAEVYRSDEDDIGTAVKIADAFGVAYLDVVSAAGETYYYWVRAVNTSGYASDFTDSVNATTTVVEATGIDDFAITATKQYTNTVVLMGESSSIWASNNPGAGSISWAEHPLVHNGKYYTVAAGDTSNRYVTWTAGNTGGSGTVADPYLTTYSGDAAWTSAMDKFQIATNEGGTVQVVWNSSANMVIGSAFILNAAITDAKIVTMTADKLTAGTIDASVITVTNLNASNITVGSLGDSRISSAATWNAKLSSGDVGDMAFEDLVEFAKLGTTVIDGGYVKTSLLTADNIQAGTLTGRTIESNGAGGQQAIIDSADNTFKLKDASANVLVTIDDTLVGSQPGINIESADGGIMRCKIDATHFSQMTAGAIGLVSTASGGELDRFTITQDSNYVVRLTELGHMKCTGLFLGSAATIQASGGTEVINESRVLQNVTAAAGIITSGTFDSDRIPNLSAAKITTGTMSPTRVLSATANRVAQFNSSTGVLEVSSITTTELNYLDNINTNIRSKLDDLESRVSDLESADVPSHSLTDHTDVWDSMSPSGGDVLTYSDAYSAWDAE